VDIEPHPQIGELMLDARVKILCEQASNEHDPDKLAELTKEINDLLEQKRKRMTDELFADAKIHARPSPRHTKQKRGKPGSDLPRF
jgi:hypothetical protein